MVTKTLCWLADSTAKALLSCLCDSSETQIYPRTGFFGYRTGLEVVAVFLILT